MRRHEKNCINNSDHAQAFGKINKCLIDVAMLREVCIIGVSKTQRGAT
jgi:hypothetical protein